jgi:hypothetical protein
MDGWRMPLPGWMVVCMGVVCGLPEVFGWLVVRGLIDLRAQSPRLGAERVVVPSCNEESGDLNYIAALSAGFHGRNRNIYVNCASFV